MLENKKVFILGMAKSGFEAAKLLAKNNRVLLTDKNNQNDEQVKELVDLGVKCIFTSNQVDLLDDTYDIVIKNPGVPLENPVILKANSYNIPVINEMELAYHYLKDVKIIGITGSNGKTTTTTIIYKLLKEMGLNVHLGGNIGYPLCSLVDKVKSKDILILEISDHQLVNFKDFKTDISVLTNLSEVHLDFHGSYDSYKNVKKKIFNHHTNSDLAILNADNSDVMELTNDIESNKTYFSSSKKSDCYLDNGSIYYNDELIIDTKDIKIKGNHNYENVMCAIMVCKQFNINNDIIKKVLANFNGVEHRIEYVKDVNGRLFYNDSKATNVKSTEIALSSFSEPTILIMGGLDRGHSFDELKSYLRSVKSIVCYGETKERINDFAISNNINCIVVDNLEEATKKAYELSSEGYVILLSPACASWDQYKCFEDRGDEFKRVIDSL